MKNKVHFETLGCRLNQDETEGAARFFSNADFEVSLESVTAKTEKDLDVALCVVNTCTVTSKAEQKARRIIRLLLEKFPLSFIIVTGCYAELNPLEIMEIDPSRIIIIPGTEKYILSSVAEALKNKTLELTSFNNLTDFIKSISKRKYIFETDKNKFNQNVSNLTLMQPQNPFVLYTSVFEKHSRGSIKIQDGCNNSCSFCRIHLARGKSVSLSASTVVERILKLEEQGVNEVVFTGVNLSQYYSVEESGTYDFADLLSLILSKTKKIRLRISSFYPQSITEKLCDVLKNERIQNSFHLSIQSGSENILALMNRPYKLSAVYNAVKLLRSAKENPFISCDIIAGFPGETEEDFNDTKKMCGELNFSYIHAFPFSPRPGTPAYTMKNQITERIKNERVKYLTKKANEGKIAYINAWKGKIVSAVVENSRALRMDRTAEKNEKTMHVVTENFLHAQVKIPLEKFDSNKYKSGSLINVVIDEPLCENILLGSEIECSAYLKD